MWVFATSTEQGMELLYKAKKPAARDRKAALVSGYLDYHSPCSRPHFIFCSFVSKHFDIFLQNHHLLPIIILFGLVEWCSVPFNKVKQRGSYYSPHLTGEKAERLLSQTLMSPILWKHHLFSIFHGITCEEHQQEQLWIENQKLQFQSQVFLAMIMAKLLLQFQAIGKWVVRFQFWLRQR